MPDLEMKGGIRSRAVLSTFFSNVDWKPEIGVILRQNLGKNENFRRQKLQSIFGSDSLVCRILASQLLAKLCKTEPRHSNMWTTKLISMGDRAGAARRRGPGPAPAAATHARNRFEASANLMFLFIFIC